MNTSPTTRRCAAVAAALIALYGLVTLAAPATAATAGADRRTATPAPADYPPVGAGTHILNDATYLTGFNDPAWYEANIPFVDLPDQTTQSVYYYRWRVWKEHLRYTNPTDGWLSTEFLDCCGYAAPYQAIDAAAGHQITEGRWLRDQSYVDDDIRFWLAGPGAGPKPATDDVNADTTDWAHEYSVWLASAAYGQATVTGDFAQLRALLPQLVRQYRGWDKQFNSQLGLYWSVPVWDAMEFSASSYASADPYHGGAGYRPTLNSYQYGDAVAISAIARMVGNTQLSDEYAKRAADLKSSMQTWLWDPSRGFYYTMARDDNPSHALSGSREEIGYLPWMFGAAGTGDTTAWAQLLDPQGFASAYGPTTAERRSPWFMYQASNCCRWDGPSWPFATAQTLTAMANLLDDYPAQTTITASDYANALQTYARTQLRNGKPYVAEAHDPDQNQWSYDGYNHSEDYNHSTFDDLVLSGLLGLRPQDGDTIAIKPLVPSGWDHFAAENVPYHGHNVTLLWDRDGTQYGQGAGMRVYIDGELTRVSPTLRPMTVDVGSTISTPHAGLVNDAANPLRQGYPKPITSYTWRDDNAWSGIDGKTWYNEVPEDTRWTNYSSPNTNDYYGVDFGVPTSVSDIRWYGYDDGGGVRPAAAYRVQYWDGSGWQDVPDQTRTPRNPAGNGLNRITFAPITTTQLRLLFTNPAGAYVGVSELESWSPSSGDAAVTSGPTNAAGDILVTGATPVTVTVQNNARQAMTGASVALALPNGWTAQATGSAPGTIPPSHSATWHFTITPATNADPGTLTALVATASYRTGGQTGRGTHARQDLLVGFPPSQQDPVASWTLDEGAGTIAHDGAATHDLTLAGGPSWVPGESGTALQFDGRTQYGLTSGPVIDTTGDFTVSAWVRPDATGAFETAVSQDGTSTSGFFLQYSVADNRFAFATGEGRALSDQPPAAGVWYHLVGVHDAAAGTYTLYVDGHAQQTVWHQAQGDPAPGPLAVGRAFSAGHNSDFWPGAIDQVHVWNRVLSAAEVAAWYAAGA